MFYQIIVFAASKHWSVPVWWLVNIGLSCVWVRYILWMISPIIVLWRNEGGVYL